MKLISSLCAVLGAAGICFFVISCSNDEHDPLTKPNATVYVAGSERVDGKWLAVYWKDGVKVILSDGNAWEFATSILVVGEDIYVTGMEITESGTTTIAKYWKNGVEQVLTDGEYVAAANAIAVSGTDVYVAGYEYTAGGIRKAKYWKNGEVKMLTDDEFESRADDIQIIGSDVYMGGVHFNDDVFETSYAVYWKNDVEVRISDGSKSSFVTDMAVSGNDLYLLSYTNPLNANFPFEFLYWKNNHSTQILYPGYGYISVSGIAVSGSDVYVSGFRSYYYEAVSLSSAVYWKNGVATGLTKENGTIAYATDIAAHEDHVYVAGFYDTYDLPGSKAAYWFNGKKINLPGEDTDASGIFVVPKK